MAETAQLLTEHYQKTFELTMKLWEQRNRTFLILLLVVGLATLLTFNPTKLVAEPLVVDYIAKTLGSDRDALRAGFPYFLIQSILLMVVLYFMVILYHRTTLISRNYIYLAAVEEEIRNRLELAEDELSFTREGRFYEQARSPFQRQIGLAYITMLGVLLMSFLGARIYADFSIGLYWLVGIDMILAIPALLFFLAYAYVSSRIISRLVSKLPLVSRIAARPSSKPT